MWQEAQQSGDVHQAKRAYKARKLSELKHWGGLCAPVQQPQWQPTGLRLLHQLIASSTTLMTLDGFCCRILDRVDSRH